MIIISTSMGWVVYSGSLKGWLLRDLKWHIAGGVIADFTVLYYKTKEEAETTLLKWEATVP